MTEQRRLGTILGHLKATSASAIASPGYRYTRDTECAGKLSQEQQEFYEKNGFLVVKKVVPLHKLDTYVERFRKICMREVEVSWCAAGVCVNYTVHVLPTGTWDNYYEGCLHC